MKINNPVSLAPDPYEWEETIIGEVYAVNDPYGMHVIICNDSVSVNQTYAIILRTGERMPMVAESLFYHCPNATLTNLDPE